MTKAEREAAKKRKQAAKATIDGMDKSTPFRFSPERIFTVKRGQKDRALSELSKDNGMAAKRVAVSVSVQKEKLSTGSTTEQAKNSLKATINSALKWFKNG